MKCLAELEETQWWPPERIEQLQSERLRQLVEYAYDRVPYYRRLMDERGLRPHDIQSAADLPKLPILTKDIIRDNLEETCSEGPLRNRLVPGQTSESAGSPLPFYGSIDEQRCHGHRQTPLPHLEYQSCGRCRHYWRSSPAPTQSRSLASRSN